MFFFEKKNQKTFNPKSAFQNLAWRVRWRSFLSTGAERPFGGREHRSAKDGRQMAARAGFERCSKHRQHQPAASQ
jgi:hypothetical protein